MATDVQEWRFVLPRAVTVAPERLVPLALELPGSAPPDVRCVDGHVHFDTIGWYEVLLSVAWDDRNIDGTRFAHSKIPGQQPLHSEAIDASVLARISGGRQLLRGNTVFGHDHTSELVLEVWQDSGVPVAVHRAELIVRALGDRRSSAR
jgi:hypothetical protein